jgi:hypothetical protein
MRRLSQSSFTKPTEGFIAVVLVQGISIIAAYVIWFLITKHLALANGEFWECVDKETDARDAVLE